MSSWERIDDILTPEGISKLKPGKTLTFDYEGSKVHLKVMRVTDKGHVWAKHLALFTPEELHLGHEINATPETLAALGAPYCITCECRVGPEITPLQFDDDAA